MSLKAENITKYYGTQCVLDKVSFILKEGEITGFLGPNGAGKTTTMNIITGYLQEWSGNVSILGKDLRANSFHLRKSIGYLPEHNPINEQLYVKEYLDYVAKIYLPKNKVHKAVKEVIEKVDLGKEQHKKIGQLSKGYKQRVGLAQALIHEPKVLILDEPTTGLDPNQLELIRQLIRTEGKNKTVLLSTHIMQEVEALCDRTLIINKGKIVSDSQTQISSQVVKIAFAETITDLQLPFKCKTQRLTPSEFLVYSEIKEDIRKLLFAYAKEQNLTLVHLSKEKQEPTLIFKESTK
ncbi:protein involved in gliding motility GldA [Balneicella halophila]|uniref:Protein involved in gliding motility GldA n=1 Tax=Balneicella halophila TaxID=1537566 RepID=A0A7L4UT69_BALHA|nr:ATP-binding cassette domain-containing protein [Balneicella halophila]PVX52264.1 protein involved in gliding motility GldA [Balneicella halophila]